MGIQHVARLIAAFLQVSVRLLGIFKVVCIQYLVVSDAVGMATGIGVQYSAVLVVDVLFGHISGIGVKSRGRGDAVSGQCDIPAIVCGFDRPLVL